MGNKPVLVAFLLFAVGCGGSAGKISDEELKKMVGGQLKTVVPVSGTVTVDGSGVSGVVINLYELNQPKPIKTTRTGSDGKYSWSTYNKDDGLPVGEYKLTFVKTASRNSPTDDQLKGRYSNVSKSNFTLKVESGQPQKNVDYELLTK